MPLQTARMTRFPGLQPGFCLCCGPVFVQDEDPKMNVSNQRFRLLVGESREFRGFDEDGFG